MPDDHSKVVPLLPIPNRTVKRLSADDSADSRVKVGHRQASNSPKRLTQRWGVLLFAIESMHLNDVSHQDASALKKPRDLQISGLFFGG